MMNYETFKGIVENEFLASLGPDFADLKLEVRPITKVNVTLDALNIVSPGSPTQIVPTIYINDMYEKYKQTGDLTSIIGETAKVLKSAMEEGERLLEKIDLDNAQDNIIFQIINREQNKELLSTTPYRNFEDLAIIYRLVIEINEDGIASCIIHDNMAEHLGLSEEDLFRAAVINTKEKFPPVVMTMEQVMRDIFEKDGMPEEVIEMMIPALPEDQQMYVITNERGVNGAISMIYEEELFKLSEKVGDDLYILPSSVHEVIAVSASMGEPEELAEMVRAINMDQVAMDERLSNQVYKYDRNTRTLKQVTDTPNKSLTESVAEQSLIYDKQTKR